MSILGRRCSVGSVINLGSYVLEQMGSVSRFTTMYQPLEKQSPLENIRVVDFRSDATSKPTEKMRRVMYEAEVGDDVMGEDPTVNELERRAAEMFGKEASIFVPSGTMGNLIATMAHCDRRGSEIIVGDKSHMLLWEQSGPAQLGGIQLTTVTNLPDGTFDLDELSMKVRDGSNIHTTKTSLICVENTHSGCGGLALPLPWIEKLAKISRDLQIPLHMDGARVFSAALCSGVSVSELTKDFSSVSVCLSKLGAPVGSMLVGDQQFINRSRYLRKVLGGGWRQAGVIAAAGLYALEHMVDRLAIDHARTRIIAEAIAATGTHLVSLDLNRVQSNILFLNFENPALTAQQFCERLFEVTDEEIKFFGNELACVIKAFTTSSTEMRVVLYCNITDEDVSAAIRKLQYVIREFDASSKASEM